MADETHNDEPSQAWSHRRQKIGVIVWASFLAACFASLIFFAFIDPMLIAGEDNPPAWLSSRMSGYAFGFFFFWIVTAVSSVLTAYLLDTLPPDKNKDQERAP
ncbi:MAG TPA: hypothetical protein VET48_09470 [Steroidobacteraceae bacterium]|nr:hypothetical protein [Steroidobacteraceae bacterium]